LFVRIVVRAKATGNPYATPLRARLRRMRLALQRDMLPVFAVLHQETVEEERSEMVVPR